MKETTNTKRQLIIMSLEKLSSRYCFEWFTHIPELLKEELTDYNIMQINGAEKEMSTTPGGFLDFVGTNIWKNDQATEFFKLVEAGMIDDDAVILFTDAWNPAIIQMKYTCSLMKKNWKIIAIWHGGSYIEMDPLDYLIDDKTWSYAFEESLYNAIDVNWFSTKYHRDYFFGMFDVDESKSLVSGFPMDYVKDSMIPDAEKENIIMSSARDCPGKQTWIFDELAKRLPQYTFIKTGCGLSKEDYKVALSKAKIVISFALLETLGIVTGMEAPASRALPLVPNRLCFTEEFSEYSDLVYPSEYCEQDKEVNYDGLCDKIIHNMENYEEIADRVFPQVVDHMHQKYFSATKFINFMRNF